MASVYRIHIRPKGEAEPNKSFKYCLDNQVLGLGWQVDAHSSISWEEYINKAKEKYDKYGKNELSRVMYFYENLKENDLIWTRDKQGRYYIGRVKSGWEYLLNQDAKDADIVNVVRCDLKRIPSIDEVPGKVIASFRPPRTIQAISSNAVSIYSQYLWNKLRKEEFYSFSKYNLSNIFSFLDSEETEDVIFIYLQTQGWIVVPNSRKGDTMSYEFYLINKTTSEKAIVQVKTGHVTIEPQEWTARSEKVFLFQANGKYGSSLYDNVICIKLEDIESFMLENKKLLPASISHWIDIACQPTF